MSHGDNAGRELDPHYQFLKDSPDARPRPAGSGTRGVIFSLAVHASLLLIAVTVVGRMPKSLTVEEKRVSSLPLVWTPSPGGGVINPGGGGDENARASPRAPRCSSAAMRSRFRQRRRRRSISLLTFPIPPRESKCPWCPFPLVFRKLSVP